MIADMYMYHKAMFPLGRMGYIGLTVDRKQICMLWCYVFYK